MTKRQKGRAAYSLPDAQRRRVRLSGATVAREVVEAARAAAAAEGMSLSRYIEEALIVKLTTRAGTTARQP
jgi:predicted nucleic acid-binding Zn ribbon protein